MYIYEGFIDLVKIFTITSLYAGINKYPGNQINIKNQIC